MVSNGIQINKKNNSKLLGKKKIIKTFYNRQSCFKALTTKQNNEKGWK